MLSKWQVQKLWQNMILHLSPLLYQISQNDIQRKTFSTKIMSCILPTHLLCIKYQKVNVKCFASGIFWPIKGEFKVKIFGK